MRTAAHLQTQQIAIDCLPRAYTSLALSAIIASYRSPVYKLFPNTYRKRKNREMPDIPEIKRIIQIIGVRGAQGPQPDLTFNDLHLRLNLDKGPHTATDPRFLLRGKKTVINLHFSACIGSTGGRCIYPYIHTSYIHIWICLWVTYQWDQLENKDGDTRWTRTMKMCLCEDLHLPHYQLIYCG